MTNQLKPKHKVYMKILGVINSGVSAKKSYKNGQ